MTPTEIVILVIVAVGALIGIGIAYKYKVHRERLTAERHRREQEEDERWAKLARMRERERQLEAEREKLRQHPNYNNPRFNPLNPDVLMPVYKDGPVSDTAATILAKKRVRASSVPVSQTQVVGRNGVGIQSRNNVVYNDTSDDMLTGAIIAHTLNSNTDSFAATVSYGVDDKPTIREVPQETYRAPDPEPERERYTSSYTSSSNDSSSYDTSSSDSSYSSTSSD